MTDEEKAVEYVKQKYPTLQINAVFQRYVEMYLAGLHEGQPKWHDLRKDPKDLPKERTSNFSIDVMTDKGEGYFIYERGSWYVWKYNGTVPVSRWCEIPQFKE